MELTRLDTFDEDGKSTLLFSLAPTFLTEPQIAAVLEATGIKPLPHANSEFIAREIATAEQRAAEWATRSRQPATSNRRRDMKRVKTHAAGLLKALRVDDMAAAFAPENIPSWVEPQTISDLDSGVVGANDVMKERLESDRGLLTRADALEVLSHGDSLARAVLKDLLPALVRIELLADNAQLDEVPSLKMGRRTAKTMFLGSYLADVFECCFGQPPGKGWDQDQNGAGDGLGPGQRFIQSACFHQCNVHFELEDICNAIRQCR